MAIDEFVITLEESEDSLRLTAKGHVNAINSTALQYELEEAIGKGQSNIVLNMTQVDFLSSSGIRVILKTYKSMDKAGGQFRIERPSEVVKNVLGMTALEGMLLR